MRRLLSHRLPRRRGITAMIAMIYLLLFSTLALGFYESVNVAVQVSYNDRNTNAARAAGESGLEFMRYQLSQLNVDHSTTGAQLMGIVYNQLGPALNNTANLGTDSVGYNAAAQTITIPSNTNNWIALDSSGSKFQVVISQDVANQLRLVVKVRGMGRSSAIVRAVQMTFDPAPRASGIFNFGVASRGTITMNGNTTIAGATDPTKGSVLAASTQTGVTVLSMTGNPTISGDASMVQANPITSVSSGSTVAGYTPASSSYTQHVHTNVPMPPFPSIDTTAFEPYLNGGNYVSGKTLNNMTLATGRSYSFTGNTTINGILYIQTPCNVSFGGNLTINGCIIVQNTPTVPATGAANTISFAGNVTANGINTLPANATYPAGERALTNAFLLAPAVSVSFSGNFGTIGGSIIADKISFSGNAGGTIVGSVIGLKDVPLSLQGNSDILISSTGTSQYPPGVFFGNDYVPAPDTYAEVAP